MMAVIRDLQAHPDTRVDCVESMTVEVIALASGALRLTFVLNGELAGIRIPEAQPASRADGLWQHTCFEAFIRSADSPAYCEFNFSPARLWQAYEFTDYRTGDLLQPADDPAIECLTQPGRLTLHATIQPDALPPGNRLCLGLTAVIEAADGTISYWALRHAAGKPDFHHPDTFALEITP